METMVTVEKLEICNFKNPERTNELNLEQPLRQTVFWQLHYKSKTDCTIKM